MADNDHLPVYQMTAGVVPKHDGVFDGERPAAAPRMQLTGYSQNATLRDICIDFVLFTHALFFVRGQMDVDPVSHFVNTQMPGDITISVLDFSQPVFAGLDGTEEGRAWSTKVMACPKQYWQPLYKYLGGVAATHRAKNIFWLSCTMWQEFPDYLHLAKVNVLPQPVPTVPLCVFGVADMRNTVGFLNPGMGQPLRIAYAPPNKEVIAAGRQLLQLEHPVQLLEE